jgi:hypothetical protein
MTLFMPIARAEHVYPFQGHLNLVEQSLDFSVKLDQEAAVKMTVDHKQDEAYQAVIDVQNLKTPFFEMTTDVQSVVSIHKNNNRIIGLSGTFWSQYSLLDHKTVPEMSGRFDLKDGVLHVDDFIVGDFTAEGSIAVLPPHSLEGAVAFDRIPLKTFLDWLSGDKKKFDGEGELSGKITLGGHPDRVAVKANIVSDGGYAGRLPYDRMSLHLEGIYPVVELTNSSITKTNGFSFDLDGTVDLSDKNNMSAQLASIKTVPLVKDSHAQSEWVLKRIQDNGQDAETKYFIKKDKGVAMSAAGTDDYGVFGVERKIGF